MTMVALNDDRTKVVGVGSIEARWLVNEGDVSEYQKHARSQPKMQAKMKAEGEERIRAQAEAAKNAADAKAKA